MFQHSRVFIRTIGIGLGVLICASASAQPNAYIANRGNNTLSIVNTATGVITAKITVPSGPAGVAVTPDGSKAYVASATVASVSPVNLSNNTVGTAIPVAANPGMVAISPDGSLVYVVNVNASEVTVISTATNSVMSTIPVGLHPTSVVFSPDSTHAYVTSMYGGAVYVINTASNAVTSFPTGAAPSAVAVTPDGTHLYVTCQGINSVNEYDTAGNLVTSIPGFTAPNSIAITHDGVKAFVTNANGASVSVIDLGSNTVVAKTTVGTSPASVAISNDGTQAYVANGFSSSLSVLSTTTNAVVLTVPVVGVYPSAVAALPVSTGPTCTFQVTGAAINNGTISFSQTGGSVTVDVTASSNTCSWGVNGPNWITLQPSGTSGNGTVTITVGANNTTQTLSGTITIAGHQFTVSQAGITCTYTATLTNGSLAFGSSGGSATITVTTASPCTWSVSGPNWTTLTPSPLNMTGSGSVAVSAGSNNSTQALNGTITVANQPFSVSEAAISCNYNVTLTSGTLSFGVSGGSATLAVTTQSPCTWTVSGPNWTTLTPSPLNMTGSGTVGVSAGANGTINQLSGNIVVANQTFPTTEQGATCTYSLSGTTNLGAASGSSSVTVTTLVGCPWSVSASPSWTNFNAGTSGSGTGSVSFTYTTNNSTSSRPGTITIQGHDFGLTQAGLTFSNIYMKAGGPGFTDANSITWQGDTGRDYAVTTATIQGTSVQALYQTQAYAPGAGLTYQFNVPDGNFTVTLLLAETYFSTGGERPMNVVINGQTVDSFDIINKFGAANTAYSVSYPVTVSGTPLTITLQPASGGVASLAALEVTQP